MMDAPYQAAPDVHVLPTNMAIPGVGVLPINAYLLTSEEPVLIDAGIGAEEDFIDALASLIDLSTLRWVWLTHDDADHTGNIERVFELAPNARLVTHAFSAMRMASWWPVPMDRVYAMRVGDRLPVGDRTLRAIAPPVYDNPMSTGLLDEATGSLFSVDSFGAFLPEATQDAAEVPAEALAGGMAGWAASDSPWTQLVDRQKFAEVLEGVRSLQPTRIFSSHLPAASGTSLDNFLQILESVPDAEPELPPSHEEFSQMLAMMMGAQAEPQTAAST